MTAIKTWERRRLMEASEESLWEASAYGRDPERRVAKTVVTDAKLYEVWRPHFSHALDEVVNAKHRDWHMKLRRQATLAQHGRTLIDHVRINGIQGAEREQLFAQFFPQVDYRSAILKEHRRYVLNVSSDISLRSLLEQQDDASGLVLLARYRLAYKAYFDLYCEWVELPAGAYCEVMRLAMLEARRDAEALRHELLGIRYKPGLQVVR